MYMPCESERSLPFDSPKLCAKFLGMRLAVGQKYETLCVGEMYTLYSSIFILSIVLTLSLNLGAQMPHLLFPSITRI